jgi:hypothetical protein
MVVGFIMTLPDFRFSVTSSGSMAIGGLVLPILIYLSRTRCWLALDLTVHPPDDEELAAAAAAPSTPRRDLPRSAVTARVWRRGT